MQSQDNTREYFRTKRQNQLVQEPLDRVGKCYPFFFQCACDN